MLQKGFTLIELMIVVAIIGILSMFALPAYQDYTKRTYVSEGLALASGAKLAITEVFSTTGIWPATNKDAGLAEPIKINGQAVDAIGVAGGATVDAATGALAENNVSKIVIYYNAKVTGAASTAPQSGTDKGTVGTDGTLTLAPVDYTESGSVKWVCTGGGAYSATDNKLSTSIDMKWLPANCRDDVVKHQS